MASAHPTSFNSETPVRRVLVPRTAALVAGFREVVWLSPDGEIEALSVDEARHRLETETAMVCHARAVARRLDIPGFAALDLLELFAFVRPARFCVPTPRGLAEALDLPIPADPVEEALSLQSCAGKLLEELRLRGPSALRRIDQQGLAFELAKAGWAWGPAVVAALEAAHY